MKQSNFAWLDRIGTISDCVELINRFGWNLTYSLSFDTWTLYGGDQILLTTTDEDTVNSMVYGMALVYDILPENMIKVLTDEFQQTLTGDDYETGEDGV